MQAVPNGEVIRSGDLEIRPGEFLALARGRALTLSLRELADDRSVDVYVHKLRSKLAGAVPECRFIHTHFGFGYRFQPEPSHPFHKTETDR
jgi:hypothetical protein